MKDMAALGSNHKIAAYKGLRVDVFTVNKTEINLTRQDLVELINVRNLFIYFIFSYLYFINIGNKYSNFHFIEY